MFVVVLVNTLLVGASRSFIVVMDGSGAVSPEALSPVDDIGEDEEDDPVVNEVSNFSQGFSDGIPLSRL